MRLLPNATCTSAFRSHSGLALAFALLLLPCATARAQFNGPASTTPSSEINRRTELTTDRTMLFPAVHDQLLGPGDVVQIHIFGQPEYAPAGRISTDGSLELPLIGVVHLAGITITDAEHLVAHDLEAAGMYKDPQVSLQITEGPNSVVTLIGEVHGVIPVAGSRRLLDVLSAAGGLPPTASHVVTINRPGESQPLVIDLGSDPMRSELANVPVFAGDTIVVGRIGVVYMIGSFKTPGVINLTPYAPLTLLQATAISGGITADAKNGDLRIIRTIGDRREVVKLDAHAVLYGKAADPILQPNDIVFLPSSTIKAILEQGGIGAALGDAGIAISALAYTR
ncbi:MAG: polysaccharide biosynthesis/export family protein, partial [Acidobacteriota bacterium]